MSYHTIDSLRLGALMRTARVPGGSQEPGSYSIIGSRVAGRENEQGGLAEIPGEPAK